MDGLFNDSDGWDAILVAELNTVELKLQSGRFLRDIVIVGGGQAENGEASVDRDIVLPAITLEMKEKIRKICTCGPANERLIANFDQCITRKDIYTLTGQNWLNDEVINFYMSLLIARSHGLNGLYPKVHAMNTFFYSKLRTGGHSSLKRWTRKVDLFAQDLVIVPIHLGSHWCVAIVDFRDDTISYYDSMGGTNERCLAVLRKYLEDESIDKKKRTLDTKNWTLRSMKNIPQQHNSSDCGVFACMFAEFVSANRKITFTQKDMPYFRDKMIYEILQGKLL